MDKRDIAIAHSYEDRELAALRAEVERLQAELVDLRALADKRTRDERDGWCEREGECWLADGPCAGHDRHREGPLLQGIADDDARSAQHVDELYATIDDLTAEVERLREELLKIKFAVAVYDDSSDRWRSDFDASCAGGTLADAVRAVCDEFLPAPPKEEE